jgi:hypothetical protein
MAVPDTKVFVQFDLEASDVAFFTLDDNVQGVLDGIYGLGGDVLVDVTEYVASVSIGRGKSRELDRFAAGQATVTFHNDNRYFDPFFIDSPYYQQFVPKREVVITSNGIDQFTGYIDDIDLTYNLGNKSFASISCSDAFSQLTSTTLNEFTNVEQFSGDRIVSILNKPEVNWSLTNRNIDTGEQLLQADLVDENTNTLTYLQLIEQSEPGALFISRDGKVTFKDRVDLPSVTGNLIFSDDNSGISYSQIEVIYGSENLYNRVTITRANGTAQVVDDTFSQSVYGIQALSQDGLLMNDDSDALELAQYLTNQYKAPELRFASVGVKLHDKELATQNDLFNLEINDVVQIVFTPNGIGDPISEFALITGISHNVSIDQHTIDFEFGSATNFPFILDNETYGILSGDGFVGYPLAFWG